MYYLRKISFVIFYLIIAVFLTVSCNNTVKNNKIDVAVFGGSGASSVCILETMEALKIDTEIKALVIQSYQIQNGELDNFDVLIFPGGSGSKELNNIGKAVVYQVKNFAKKRGKGIVGICAGGYLLSTTPGYPSLEIISARETDRKHYNRGRGLVEIELTKKGLEIFPELINQSLFLQYYDGPVLTPNGSEKAYNELATFKTDIHPDDFAPKGITPGKTFMLEEKYGEGIIMTVAGHPESTPGMRWIVARMVRKTAGLELVSYNKKWIRPEINDSSIVFDANLRKIEKDNFWKLFDDSSNIQIKAMDNLHKLRSRPAVRYNIGLLRDINPEIRKHAAYLLRKTEYTSALNDLKQALKCEKDSSVITEIKKTIDFMTNF
ncbi:MAG: DJ-1/PfpI family protein [Bacteroidetes bacterium]|nr:DJ-1/PfpI family protein [Bacteroidota bacterium]